MAKASNQVKNTPITLEDIKKSCNHVGFLSAPAQSIFVAGAQLMIVCTTSCTRCGHLFTNINPYNLEGGGGLAIATPKLDPKDFINKK